MNDFLHVDTPILTASDCEGVSHVTDSRLVFVCFSVCAVPVAISFYKHINSTIINIQ